jgi:diamine N-acetyltransferase
VDVELREITRATVRAICALRVADGQRDFVAENALSIAQAHFDPRHWMRAIYADGEPAGFVLTIEDADRGDYYLWRFMVDAGFQRRGIGRRAMELLLERWQALGATDAKLSVIDSNHGAVALYETVGFQSTGEYVNGELVMSARLTAGT